MKIWIKNERKIWELKQKMMIVDKLCNRIKIDNDIMGYVLW